MKYIWLGLSVILCNACIIHNNNGELKNLFKNLALRESKSFSSRMLFDSYEYSEDLPYLKSNLYYIFSEIKEDIRSSQPLLSIGNLYIKENGHIRYRIRSKQSEENHDQSNKGINISTSISPKLDRFYLKESIDFSDNTKLVIKTQLYYDLDVSLFVYLTIRF